MIGRNALSIKLIKPTGEQATVSSSGAPNVNFRKISVSCLPAFPRILEHLKKGINAHF